MKKETSKLIKEVRDLVTKKEGEMILFYLSGTYFFLVDHGLNEIPVDEATILLSYENPNIKIVYFDILPADSRLRAASSPRRRRNCFQTRR